MELLVNNLSKTVDKVAIFDELSYSFKSGIVYGITGDTGSGKSLFFECLTGMHRQFDGTISIVSDDGKTSKPGYNDMEIIFAEPILPDFMVGREYIKYYMDVHKNHISTGDSIGEYLSIIDICEEDSYRLIRDYSIEEKRRLQFACNLIAGPNILLLDSPFEHSDRTTGDILDRIITKLRRDHIIIIAGRDDADLEEICDELLTIRDGKLTSFR